MKISAVVITLNEERNIGRALESLTPVADELLVVDSGSTDGTRQTATQQGARVLSHEWEGYAAQKNFAAAAAQHDWILSLDADEALSLSLAAEIGRLKDQGPGHAAGFRMPRLACYRGKWIRHSGWYPDPKLRIYDRRWGRWTGDYVHESVQVDGPVRDLPGDLLHYTCDSVGEHLKTLDRYTTLAAREALGRGEGRAFLKMVAFPPWKFAETYILRRGFLDGANGLIIAAMAGYYVWTKYAKVRAMVRRSSTSERKTDAESLRP